MGIMQAIRDEAERQKARQQPEEEIDPAAALVELLARMHDVTEAMLAATSGYRARCVAEGYSETAAELMAIQYHHALMARVLG